LEASAAGRRGVRQLAVIVTTDKLEPAFRAIPRTVLVLPHRSAADAGRNGQAAWLPHPANISRRSPGGWRTATAIASGFQSAVRAVVSGVEATGRVEDMRAPAASASRHDVRIQFAVKGDPDTSADRVQRPTGCWH